ncbi:MAG: 3-oxoacyl-[acyl-carrier-protein] reductase [Chloroflexi bacterium]|nr:3-oxoacyl-[acyl-carrier-protein] reductase [Chloroflexota bacterium]
MNDLTGKVALVTGASRGIGRAIALELGQRGCDVVINYHSNIASAQETAAQIAAPSRTLVHQADVSIAQEASGLVEAALAAFGRVDILVNNAGITLDGLSMRMPEEDWDQVLATNLKSAFNCAKAVQRSMLRQRWGRIISIGSVAGLMGNAGQANYSAAKAGLVGLTKALARELAPRGITVNLVAPGFIATDMTASLGEEILAKVQALIPLQRLGKPDEVARLVGYLASDAAAYITGQVIALDGGMSM